MPHPDWQPFRQPITLISAGGTTDDLAYRHAGDGREVVVTRVMLQDDVTTPTGALRLLITGHGEDFLLDEVPAPAVDRLYLFTDEIPLHDGETLVGRFTGATSGDVLRMHVVGRFRFPNRE